MQLRRTYLFLAATLMAFPAWSALADAPPEPTIMWECPQADGTSIYTNKEKAGCTAMVLKPLSIVPDLEQMPLIPRTNMTTAPQYAVPRQEPMSVTGSPAAPDWARDWYAKNMVTGSVQEEVCRLYGEWMHLVQQTRGGLFFGTDPSYGGDITGHNQWGASYSFYDKARFRALSRLFGTGFVPIGCF